MSVQAFSSIGAVVILIATFAIAYVVMGNLFKRTRELRDDHGESTRKRSIDSAGLRSVEGQASKPPSPSPASSEAAPTVDVLPLNPNLSPAAKEMIAEMQEQARRSDQEHRETMRAHVERRVPPLTPDGQAAIEFGKGARLANLNLNPFDAPPDDVKQKIMALVEELRVNGMPSSIERPKQSLALPRVLNSWVAAPAPRHASREHQMFGEGVVVQVAADEMKERYLLLLQLGRDPALNWTIGEMGPLQYWITPEDLAAKRFENTVLTIEAY